MSSTSNSYAGRPHVVYTKSITPNWSLRAHHGKVNCVVGRTITQTGEDSCQFFTGGDDRNLKIWNGKGGNMLTSNIGSPISCIVLSSQNLYVGTTIGEIIILTLGATAENKWNAHSQKITCLQVVSEGRVFSGSRDGFVKLFSRTGEQLRKFPASAQDVTEEVLSIQATEASLLFVGTARGNINVYNMKQDLVRVLSSPSLTGPIKKMHAFYRPLENRCNIDILCTLGHKLIAWYLNVTTDEDGENIVIDKVRALENRTSTSPSHHQHIIMIISINQSPTPNSEDECEIVDMKALYFNPLDSNQPVAYLATARNIHLYLPTAKLEHSTKAGQWTKAHRFKTYTFKGAQSAIVAIATAQGKVFAACEDGSVVKWNEPENILKLRRLFHQNPSAKWGSPHGTVNPARQAKSSKSSPSPSRCEEEEQVILPDDNDHKLKSNSNNRISTGGNTFGNGNNDDNDGYDNDQDNGDMISFRITSGPTPGLPGSPPTLLQFNNDNQMNHFSQPNINNNNNINNNVQGGSLINIDQFSGMGGQPMFNPNPLQFINFNNAPQIGFSQFNNQQFAPQFNQFNPQLGPQNMMMMQNPQFVPIQTSQLANNSNPSISPSGLNSESENQPPSLSSFPMQFSPMPQLIPLNEQFQLSQSQSLPQPQLQPQFQQMLIQQQGMTPNLNQHTSQPNLYSLDMMNIQFNQQVNSNEQPSDDANPYAQLQSIQPVAPTPQPPPHLSPTDLAQMQIKMLESQFGEFEM